MSILSNFRFKYLCAFFIGAAVGPVCFAAPTLKAKVYPIYEVPDNDDSTVMSKIEVDFKDLNASYQYRSLNNSEWKSQEMDFGREEGFYGVHLGGRYVNVTIHPEAFNNLSFSFDKLEAPFRHYYGFYPYWGKPILDSDLTSVSSDRAYMSYDGADIHSFTDYINSGFDEIQVYYAVGRFMENLTKMGLGRNAGEIKQFTAYLFDPSISMRNNAFYLAGSINLTTYSKGQPNKARDNMTIWHELGHGIHSRLMPIHENRELGEGIGDFLAKLVEYVQIHDGLVSQDYPGRENARIYNDMLFNTSNEFHDGGESYGGHLSDILEQSLAAESSIGMKREVLTKVGDLVLDALRFCGNQKAKTAEKWLSCLLDSDAKSSYATPAFGRADGEFRDVILETAKARNLYQDGGSNQFLLTYDGKKVGNGEPGDRYNPILVTDSQNTYRVAVNIKSGTKSAWQYPMKLEVTFDGGPLQGSANWKDESQGYVYTITNDVSGAVDLTAFNSCSAKNEEYGCSDYAYFKLIDSRGKVVAKNRFYVKIKQ
ncbi:MAG: hypothetical protein HQK54_10985 [Oligoflexales bacterium]|nr:hypothetical protein [Oligoflexales bacterium]